MLGMAADGELEAKVTTLMRTVAALQTRLDALEGQIRSTTHRGAGTMRGDTRCPACGGRRILHAAQVLDRGDGGRYPMAIVQPSAWRGKVKGEFELCVCTRCGACEWYARDAAEIEPDGTCFRVFEVEDPRGAGYR